MMSGQPPDNVGFRKATLADVPAMHKLINLWAGRDQMLPLNLNELYERLRDFWVAETDGGLVGCGSLHIWWENLAEIKSLAVQEDAHGRGVGSRLARLALDEARSLGAGRVFVLTYRPGFFERFGFGLIDKNELPQKIWTECVKCPKFPNCCEVALLYENEEDQP